MILLDRRPRREVDLRWLCPIQDRAQIGVGDREAVEQKFTPGQVTIEEIEARPRFREDVGARSVRRLLVEQRAEQPLVQFGADELQPLLQPRA